MLWILGNLPHKEGKPAHVRVVDACVCVCVFFFPCYFLHDMYVPGL